VPDFLRRALNQKFYNKGVRSTLRIQRSYLFVLLFFSIPALSSCGGNSVPQSAQASGPGNPNSPNGARGGRGGGQPAIEVRTTGVQRISIQRQIELSGNLVSIEQVKVSTEVAGTVIFSNIDLGKEIRAGDILIRLDDRELQLARDRAESALRQTEAQLGLDPTKPNVIPPDEQVASVRTAIANRDDARVKLAQTQELVSRGLVPRTDLDTNETRLKVFEAQLQSSMESVRSLKASLQDRRAAVQLAQKKIEDATVKSPVNGVVSERLVQRGEFIRENTQVATIVQLNPLQLRTAVQEKFSNLIRTNLPVEFVVEPFPGQMFKGRILNISPSIDELTRTFAVEVQVDNANRKLKPGFFAKGVILTERDNNVMALPEEAVSTLAGVTSTFVVDNGVIRQQSVSLGAREGKFFEILTGLTGNEIVAVSNLNQLVTGTKVTIAGAPDTEAAGESK
jgi:RND family efflux transporter MFP subunit